MSSEPSPLSTRAPWDLVAAGYTTDAQPQLTPYSVDAIRLLDVPAGAHVLDVACGPGTTTLLLAEHGCRVTAIDFAKKMVTQLRRVVVERDVAGIETHVMDGQALELDSHSFDAAVSMFGLMFFPNRARGFGELHRTLKEGGKAAVSTWCPIDESPAVRLLFGALRAAVPEMPADKSVGALDSPDKLQVEMTSAGFREVEVHSVVHSWPYETATAAWESACRGSVPFAMMAASLGAEEWAKRARLGIAHLEAAGSFPNALESTAYIGIGTA